MLQSSLPASRNGRAVTIKRHKRGTPRVPGPQPDDGAIGDARFVVQQCHRARGRFNLSIEMAGVLASWEVSGVLVQHPAVRQLAVQMEDHPVGTDGHALSGGSGAGSHAVWDSGTCILDDGSDLAEAHARGRLSLLLTGRRLHGGFLLVRMDLRGAGGRDWLLIKLDESEDEEGARRA